MRWYCLVQHSLIFFSWYHHSYPIYTKPISTYFSFSQRRVCVFEIGSKAIFDWSKFKARSQWVRTLTQSSSKSPGGQSISLGRGLYVASPFVRLARLQHKWTSLMLLPLRCCCQCPTKHYAILEPQDLYNIDVSELHKIRRSMDLLAIKLWTVRSGVPSIHSSIVSAISRNVETTRLTLSQFWSLKIRPRSPYLVSSKIVKRPIGKSISALMPAESEKGSKPNYFLNVSFFWSNLVTNI